MNNNNKTAAYKATEYLFHLDNIALENGFKPNEQWEVTMSTLTEKNAIQKEFHPTLIIGILPDLLNSVYALVRERLKQEVIVRSSAFTQILSSHEEYKFLVAYNPDRRR